MAPKTFFCNMVCWVTLYQLCIPFLDKTAATVAKCISERCIQYFGPPILVIAGQEKEFVGTQFKEFTNANSILLHVIDVRAPWQNGWTKRHGDINKRIFERARGKSTVQPFRLLFPPASVRNWTPSSRDLTSDDIDAPDSIYDLVRMRVLRSPVKFAKPP